MSTACLTALTHGVSMLMVDYNKFTAHDRSQKTSPIMIEVKNLTKRYGSFTALDGVSFKARQGEILGILGPNGAGKTTTMRILTGFMPPTDGHATIDGLDITRDSLAVRQRVGYMPERVPLYPDMTVEGYVKFWAQLRGVDRVAERVQAALERVQLHDRRRSLVRSLSKGMKQRLGLAQALVHDPPVVILDEPTIGIDPQQVIEVRENVRALAESHTVLFSTHILSEAELVCDRVIILNRGQIVAEGRPDQLRRKLQPEASLYISIGKAKPPAALSLLESLPHVRHAAQQGAGYVVRLKRDAPPDAPAIYAKRIIDAGYSVLELRPVAMTLEDIFLDIVQREGGTPG